MPLFTKLTIALDKKNRMVHNKSVEYSVRKTLNQRKVTKMVKIMKINNINNVKLNNQYNPSFGYGVTEDFGVNALRSQEAVDSFLRTMHNAEKVDSVSSNMFSALGYKLIRMAEIFKTPEHKAEAKKVDEAIRYLYDGSVCYDA